MKYSEETENFFDKVYVVTKCIPYGRVTSYGAIAKYLGAARSSRMVGWAMNGAGKYPDVPAHRVVNRVGILTGKMHFGSSNAMAQMLAEEGIQVEDDQVVNFKKIFWDPVVELGME
ncbi:MGMT family protein [uncultured Dokdonia sp.]|uniref:MGMT family protein n=1 Tax=uncultured Dokdonia sp. TaxID=575653 RepID=UPI002622CB25|nr:MGMT family protein [uncultured Dokdonia sp.]